MHILHLNQRNQILFRYLRDKEKRRKKGAQKKGGGGGENSPISPPLDPRLTSTEVLFTWLNVVHQFKPEFIYVAYQVSCWHS